ncbi:unnamed protein product, partial [Mesorhabditis belari]|uniref:RING-CH-type domain-containing protein n=1 Tax=Mesorhabditis belari TaxID=2138241 RepID=A0AAF3EY48_9BILA
MAEPKVKKVDSPHGSVISISSTQQATATDNTASTQASPTSLHKVSAYQNVETPIQAPYKVSQTLANRLFDGRLSSPSSLSSLEHRACRICQSETGDMVRPCGCAGTMGDIHEACLSKWVTTSHHRQRCEICQENYALSGAVFKNIKKWARPKVDCTDVFAVFTLLGLLASIAYLVSLMAERLLVERVFVYNLPIRSDDYARFLLTLLMTVLAFGMTALFVSQFLSYVGRQKEIRFVNKYKNDGTTETR